MEKVHDLIPEISIIVPVYNVDKYLNRCIESLVNQTFKNIEIILINDGSTDNSKKICENWMDKDNRIKLINQENKGLADARNKGIKYARGKYIGFVDSDDWITNNMYENLYDIIKRFNADISCAKFEKVKSEDEIIEKLDNSIKIYSNEDSLKKLCTFDNYKETGIITQVWNKLYKSELFREIKFPSGKVYEDAYVTYKLLFNSKRVVEINQIYYYYYQRSGSIMLSKLNDKKLISYDYERNMFKYLLDKNSKVIPYALKKYIVSYFTLYNKLLNNYDVSEESKTKCINNLKNDIRSDFKDLIKYSDSFLLRLRIIFFCINPKIYEAYIKILKKTS